jgi:hypothetical protein
LCPHLFEVLLEALSLSYTQVSDLRPLAGMPLTDFTCVNSGVRDLTGLQGLPLTNLQCRFNTIRDLTPLAQCPKLEFIDCRGNEIANLAPLATLPLTHLDCRDNPFSSLSFLARNPPRSLFFSSPALDAGEVEAVLARWRNDRDREDLAWWNTLARAFRQRDRAGLREMATPFGGHRYLFLPERMSWARARLAAEALGGHLAAITSAEEQSFLATNPLAKRPAGFIDAWIGLYSDKAGQTQWVNGEPFDYRPANWPVRGWAGWPGGFFMFYAGRGVWERETEIQHPLEVDSSYSCSGFLMEWDQ